MNPPTPDAIVPLLLTRNGQIPAPVRIGSVPLLLTRRQAAELIGSSLATVDRMSASGKLPRPLQVGGAVKYRRDDLIQWVKLGCPDRKTFEAETLSC